MKKIRLILTMVVLAAFSFSVLAGDDYKISSKSSKLEWLAKKVTGQHNGVIDIKSGGLTFSGNKLTGGNFVINMKTITVLDLEAGSNMNNKLTGHLNSPDFFNTTEFGEASFKVTSAKKAKSDGGNYSITGDLTIKGKSSSITFPAQVSKDGDKVSATAKMIFDRSKFDIKYKSASFFENLGDKLIYDDVEMTVSLVTE
ncbi:MAG: polyisoprenoid-binding protein YceI [Cyclobacteriaceae bacterium]|jgi:polyisoprenoid-binding protein YceI